MAPIRSPMTMPAMSAMTVTASMDKILPGHNDKMPEAGP